jgi:hypothetical protein
MRCHRRSGSGTSGSRRSRPLGRGRGAGDTPDGRPDPTRRPPGRPGQLRLPGATETEILASFRTSVAESRGWPVEEALERVMTEEWGMQVALGRAGRPEELGDVIAFLRSERAGYLTGATVSVDGGTDF